MKGDAGREARLSKLLNSPAFGNPELPPSQAVASSVPTRRAQSAPRVRPPTQTQATTAMSSSGQTPQSQARFGANIHTINSSSGGGSIGRPASAGRSGGSGGANIHTL